MSANKIKYPSKRKSKVCCSIVAFYVPRLLAILQQTTICCKVPGLFFTTISRSNLCDSVPFSWKTLAFLRGCIMTLLTPQLHVYDLHLWCRYHHSGIHFYQTYEHTIRSLADLFCSSSNCGYSEFIQKVTSIANMCSRSENINLKIL